MSTVYLADCATPRGWVTGNGLGLGRPRNPQFCNGTAGPEVFEKDQYYFHPDHLGSSSYVTDVDGEIYQHLEYFPFGETWIEEASNTQRTPYLFTGKELDEETGLYYFGARYYDPRTSVWQSPDPALGRYMGGGINSGVYRPANLGVYTYVFNHPINHTDQNGEFGIWGAVVGGVVSVTVDFGIAYIKGEDYSVADAGKSFVVGAVSGAVGAGIGAKAAQGYRAMRGGQVLTTADKVGVGMVSGAASGATATVIDETVEVELADGTLAIEVDPYGIESNELARGTFTGMVTGGIVGGASTGDAVGGLAADMNLPAKTGKVLGEGAELLTDVGVGQAVEQGANIIDSELELEQDQGDSYQPLRIEITPSEWFEYE